MNKYSIVYLKFLNEKVIFFFETEPIEVSLKAVQNLNYMTTLFTNFM